MFHVKRGHINLPKHHEFKPKRTKEKTPQIGRKDFERIGFEATTNQIEQTNAFLAQVLKWNGPINLISRNDEKNIFVRHFVDSVLIIKLLGFDRGASVLDIGTGAGFPSVPIKIFRDDLNITAAESIEKKSTFLRHTSRILGLGSFIVLNARLNEETPSVDKFQYILSRAVCDIREMVKISRNHLAKNGRIYTFKHNKSLGEEVKRFRKSKPCKHFEIEKTEPYSLNDDYNNYKLVSIKRISEK